MHSTDRAGVMHGDKGVLLGWLFCWSAGLKQG